MRLTSISISTSFTSEEVTFSLEEFGDNSRYLVRGIVGIDADEIVPKYYGVGAVSSRKFYEYTMPSREIVIRTVLNPIFHVSEGVSEIRDRIYRLISSDRSGQLDLYFRSGSAIVCHIKGMVTKMEVAHFSRTPELQITVKCEDPMFRSVAPVDIPQAELPTSNPISLTDDLGNAPHGFSFKVRFTASTSTFVIQDHATTPDWQWEVTPATAFATDDELHFSSEYGAKRVFWNKDVGTDIELLDKVESGSVWPQIFPGENVLYFMQIANFDWLELNFYAAYWGL